MSDKMREGFEEWASSEFGWHIADLIDARRTDDKGVECYIFKEEYDASVGISAAFMAWKASRESLVIELPAPLQADLNPYGAGYVNGSLKMRSECWEVIEKAGLKVKP